MPQKKANEVHPIFHMEIAGMGIVNHIQAPTLKEAEAAFKYENMGRPMGGIPKMFLPGDECPECKRKIEYVY